MTTMKRLLFTLLQCTALLSRCAAFSSEPLPVTLDLFTPEAEISEVDMERARRVVGEFYRKQRRLGFPHHPLIPPVRPKVNVTNYQEALKVSFDRKKSYVSPERPMRDLLIRAAFGETVEMTPTWLFRQAGRHLPEYKEYKSKNNLSFTDILANPKRVAECTMQPLRRYEVDAAILFSDILVVPQALGVPIKMQPGKGIEVPNPLTDPDSLHLRVPTIDEITDDFVQNRFGHIFQAIREIRRKMDQEDKRVPLIGFAGGPLTLLHYMVGGTSKTNMDAGMQWLREYPDDSVTLLRILTVVVVEYLSAQVEAGAHVLQVFEAMGMMFEPDSFEEFALPCLKQISKELKRRFPGVPLMVFARGADYANTPLSKLDFDVITLDGSQGRELARLGVSDLVVFQGDYNPADLIQDGTKSPESVRKEVREMLSVLGPQQLIANLCEGLGGKESPFLVNAFVDAVHEESVGLIKEQREADRQHQ